MNAKRIALAGMLAAVTLAAVATTGCSKKTRAILVPNQLPTVRLTAAPYDTSRATPYFYAYRINWLGNDPDGRVEYYLYAVDPPNRAGVPVNWTRTTRNEQIVFFTADSSSARTGLGTAPHVFAICAVDNSGDTSEVAQRGFFSYTQAPTVTIVSPRPNRFSPIFVTPSVRVQWTGSDPDGQLTAKPVKYKYLLLGSGGAIPVDEVRRNPDTLRTYFAYEWYKHGLAGPWAGWDSTSAETTFKQFTNLTPNSDYLFAVISFDEAGAFSPTFDLTQNMLWLRPGFASTLGPRLSLFNEFFFFQYPSGGWTTNVQAEIQLEVPAAQPISFFWIASPPAGSLIESYQWMLDGDPTVEAIRETQSDYTHWSQPSEGVVSATVGPFAGKTEHFFYVQATDNNGLQSLGIVHMRVVQATFERPLMVVDDVRFQPEVQLPSGCLDTPKGNWPNMAELDSFFFARGNVPWQCVTPAGNSEPGIFNGYTYDVYRTGVRTGSFDRTVRLDTLGKYRNVVWIVDGTNVGLTTMPGSPPLPAYSLRYMSGPGRVNTLGAYSRQGGRVWVVGSGGAFALCKDLFDNANNNTFTFTYSNRQPTELQPGRMMYDIAHWRSELQNYPIGSASVKRSVRAEGIMASGGWSMPVLTKDGLITRSNPDYNLLPPTLDAKTPATDQLPATRVSNPSNFFRSRVTYNLEYLSQPNSILEDINPDPVAVTERATLDTLMKTEVPLAAGYRAWEIGGPDPLTGLPKPGSVPGTPLMTYYHGQEFPEFVFSGFDIWNYQRAQCIQVVDFVLQQIFGLTKTVPAGAPHMNATRGGPRAWTPPADQARTVSAGRGAPVTPAATSRPGSHE